MKTVAYITTSWDDGHPLDARVAELLAKYDLPGTFYVPKTAEFGTMSTAQLQELSSAFEVGAHTLRHVILTSISDQVARDEIVNSKSWVEDTTGLPCRMFCPPSGRYSSRDLEMIRGAGFIGMRSVALLSLERPRAKSGLVVLPTSIQAHPHSLATYAKNTIKRAAFKNLWRYALRGPSSDWVKLAESLLHHSLEHGGVFHLWGHSWELQETCQWQRLEEVLRFISQFNDKTDRVNNCQVCQAHEVNHNCSAHESSAVPSLHQSVGDPRAVGWLDLGAEKNANSVELTHGCGLSQ
jgi:peptidoglycan/xylan/chitin deacetylase (PgdA/CDA1 family)